MPDTPNTWYLVATDDGSDEAYTTAREAGAKLAAEADAGVILYDRTSESKLTNPYPSGPWSDEDDAVSPESELEPHTLREMGRGYLADQMIALRDGGVATRAHLAVDTGGEALGDAIKRYQPRVVVFPQSATEGGTLLDKLGNDTVGDELEDTMVEVILIDGSGEQVDPG